MEKTDTHQQEQSYENSHENNHEHEHCHEHHHEHHHEVHYSHRAGHNRITSSQRKRALYGKILFTILSVVAAFIIAVILYDRLFGLF